MLFIQIHFKLARVKGQGKLRRKGNAPRFVKKRLIEGLGTSLESGLTSETLMCV